MRSGKIDLPQGVTRTIKPHKTYWYYTPNRGKPNQGECRRLPEPGTQEWHDEIEAIRREQAGTPAVYDIRSLVRDYKQTAGWLGHQQSTRETYEAALKPIVSKWRYKRPIEIEISDVTSLVERLATKPAMANMTLVVARKLLQYAVRKGLRKDNPAREVEKAPEAKDGAKPLSPAVWAALRAPECPEAVQRLAVLGRYTGQRISDLIGMRPSDRDEDGISHTIKKLRGKQHWSFLTEDQAREIDGWACERDSPYLLKSSGALYTTDSLRAAWNAYARTRAGKVLAGYTPHDLRATKVCDERIAGKSHQQIAAMVGMSAPMVMKYSRHIDQRSAARGGVSAPPPMKRGLPQIYTLEEVASHLRVPMDEVKALARLHLIGAQFGEALRFREDDIQDLWERACSTEPVDNW